MSSSETRLGGDINVDSEAQTRVLVLGGVQKSTRTFDLTSYGFVGQVSEQAREEILRNEQRTALALNAAVFALRT